MTALLALESTVISHGLPYPQNIAAARRFEQIAREHGAEPRTVAIEEIPHPGSWTEKAGAATSLARGTRLTIAPWSTPPWRAARRAWTRRASGPP